MLVCFSAVLAMAQKPMNTHYVYEVRNDQGNLIQSTAVTCTLKVVKNTDTIFKETHSATTDNLGRITVTLGKGIKLGETEYKDVTWSKTDNYILYATVNTGRLILGSEVPLLVGTNADSTTVLNLFGTKLPLARVATSGSYSDLTNRPTSMSQFNNDAHFLTSDSAVIQTMKSNIQTNQSNIATNAGNITTNTTDIATNTANIELLKLTNFDTIYNKSEQDAKLHLTKDYGFKIFNWGNLPQNEAAVYILNKSGDGVTKTSALTAKDNDDNPSMTAFLVGKDPTSGQAAVIGTVNQGENPITGALGYSKNGQAAAVMANGPIAFGNGHYATDINNTNALSGDTSEYTLVTEATLSGSIQNLATVAKTGSYTDLTDQPTIPTTVAELTDANDYAKLAGNNNFSGENTFSGDVTFSDTVIVPSGFNFTTTTSESCNMAVNACDLLTVFDSIQRQFTALRAEIDGLRDSLKDLRGASEPEFTAMNFERAENSLTATATFNDHGATITEYEFCISTSQEMTDPTCHTTTDANYTFSGLNAGTQYYVTVAATNLKGTTTSDAQGVQTVHAKPVLGVPTATAVSNTEIEVTGELTDMGGTTPTTVTVYAYTNSDYNDAEPIRGTDSIITSVPKDYKVNVGGLAKGTTYYLAVIADNGDKQDTMTASATTLNITVTVTSDQTTDTILTGSNVDVTVKYTATVSGIDEPTEDGYSWKVNDTDSTSTSNELTVHYTEAGTYTVVCAYNDATYTVVTVLVPCDTITFVPNGGTSGTMDKQIVERGKATKLTQNAFTHPGEWVFVGWNTVDDGTGTSYADEANITVNGNDTLYAQWLTYCPGIVRSNETGNGRIESVKDYEGNTYTVVKIGEQCWMKQNLKSTKYANGNNISDYSVPGNNNANVALYGYLYTENAVMNGASSCETNPSTVQGICPNGWHVPSPAEWVQMKESILNTPNYVAENCDVPRALSFGKWRAHDNPSDCLPGGGYSQYTNRSGFSALSAGYYSSSAADFGTDAYFRTSKTDNVYSVCYDVRTFISYIGYGLLNYGLSVRCVRNESLSAVTKTDSTARSLSVSATCALENITTATVCAYTDAECNTGEVCATEVSSNASPITATISGLNANTPYYVKVTVTTANGEVSKVGGPFKTATPNACNDETTLSDNDNHTYPIVALGTQCWMAEDLRTTKSNTGVALNSSSYDIADNYSKYLYSVVNTICPNGWHLPSYYEWQALFSFVGSQEDYQCDGQSANYAKALASTSSAWETSAVSCAIANDLTSNNRTNFNVNPNDDQDGFPATYYYTATKSNEVYPEDISHFNLFMVFDANSATVTDVSFNVSDPSNGTYLALYPFTVRCVRNAASPEYPDTPGGGDNPGGGDTPQCTPTSSEAYFEINILPALYEYCGRDTTFEAGTETGNYTFHCTNAAGCDSTITLHVTVSSSSEEEVTTDGCPGVTCVDADGNNYNTVLIGTQCWMAQNLKTTKYANNTSIQSDDRQAMGSTILYKGTILNNGVCPTGWHVPSKTEWETLINNVNQYLDCAVKALCSKTGWGTGTGCYLYDDETNNATGFNVFPMEQSEDSQAYYWTSTYDQTIHDNTHDDIHNYFVMFQSGNSVNITGFSTSTPMGIRCVHDANN